MPLPNDALMRALSTIYHQFVKGPADRVSGDVAKIQALGNTTPDTFPSDLWNAGMGALGVLGSPSYILDAATKPIGQVTSPGVGQALSLAGSIPLAGGRTNPQRLNEFSRLAKIAKAAESPNIAKMAGTFADEGAAIAKTGRVFAPTPKELGTVNELVSAAEQGMFPANQVEKFRKLVATKLANPEDAAKLSPKDIINYVDTYDLWPRTYLNEMPKSALDDLVQKGWITEEEAAQHLASPGTVNSDKSWIENLKRQAATMRGTPPKEPYSSAPDNLMGYGKPHAQKGYAEQGYRKSFTVEITLPSGEKFIDEIKGLNRPHALERARRNWEGSGVVVLNEGPPK